MFETQCGKILIPEFCFLTGLSKEQLNSPNHFNLVREVLNATEVDIHQKLINLKKLFFDTIQKESSIFPI